MWRAPHLRSLDGFLTTVPNSTINAAAVDVMRTDRGLGLPEPARAPLVELDT